MNARKRNIFFDEELNPCLEESNLTRECMEMASYDSSKCTDFFNNYKGCKQFWHKIYKLRRSSNIEPYLPSKEERNKIRKEMENGNFVIQAP